MPLSRDASTHAAQQIQVFTEIALNSWATGEVTQEPQLTDRILGSIKTGLELQPIAGIRWSAHTLGDRGPGSPESLYGADALVVLNIDVEHLTLSKGFLAQAKILDPSGRMSQKEFDDLRDQCTDMLAITPDSFVWLYHSEGIAVLPAISVLGLDPTYREPGAVNRWTFEYFNRAFIDCFVGDGRLEAANLAELERVAEEVGARSALLLEAREVGQ